jgi:hypothetical protein
LYFAAQACAEASSNKPNFVVSSHLFTRILKPCTHVIEYPSLSTYGVIASAFSGLIA